MCVIVYKPAGNKFPAYTDLKACFDMNSDGAGYMLPYKGKVIIRKGFMSFESFKKDIKKVMDYYNLDYTSTPVVMHFRISTQGGVKRELCHPFPICRDYGEMRKLSQASRVAMVHNGIIRSCSESDWGYRWDRQSKRYVKANPIQLDHNDTMKFIKDYASLILRGSAKLTAEQSELLQRISESKLAFMDGHGHVSLIGDFEKHGTCYYSNTFAFRSPQNSIEVCDCYEADDTYEGGCRFEW